MHYIDAFESVLGVWIVMYGNHLAPFIQQDWCSHCDWFVPGTAEGLNI